METIGSSTVEKATGSFNTVLMLRAIYGGLGSGHPPAVVGYRAYLDPKEPTFLGFLIMNSLYKSLKR